jgi:hypothetical protein
MGEGAIKESASILIESQDYLPGLGCQKRLMLGEEFVINKTMPLSANSY